jgi:hypothetical protein
MAAQIAQKYGITFEPVFVDARPKLSASNV